MASTSQVDSTLFSISPIRYPERDALTRPLALVVRHGRLAERVFSRQNASLTDVDHDLRLPHGLRMPRSRSFLRLPMVTIRICTLSILSPIFLYTPIYTYPKPFIHNTLYHPPYLYTDHTMCIPLVLSPANNTTLWLVNNPCTLQLTPYIPILLHPLALRMCPPRGALLLIAFVSGGHLGSGIVFLLLILTSASYFQTLLQPCMALLYSVLYYMYSQSHAPYIPIMNPSLCLHIFIINHSTCLYMLYTQHMHISDFIVSVQLFLLLSGL